MWFGSMERYVRRCAQGRAPFTAVWMSWLKGMGEYGVKAFSTDLPVIAGNQTFDRLVTGVIDGGIGVGFIEYELMIDRIEDHGKLKVVIELKLIFLVRGFVRRGIG